jgi:hypothetical protein
MEQKTFTGPTLEEARKAKERWLSAHKVAVRKENHCDIKQTQWTIYSHSSRHSHGCCDLY